MSEPLGYITELRLVGPSRWRNPVSIIAMVVGCIPLARAIRWPIPTYLIVLANVLIVGGAVLGRLQSRRDRSKDGLYGKLTTSQPLPKFAHLSPVFDEQEDGMHLRSVQLVSEPSLPVMEKKGRRG